MLASPLDSTPCALLGALTLVGCGLVLCDATRAGDPPGAGPRPGQGSRAIPISGSSNVYGIPGEREVELWTGHLGGDCRPRLLARPLVYAPEAVVTVSADTSTLAYLGSTSLVFERRAGLSVRRGVLTGGFTPGVTGALDIALSSDGRRAAYVTRDETQSPQRTTLWTLDLGAPDEQGLRPLPAQVRPKRIKRGAPGALCVPVGWSPDSRSLIYFELTPVRGRHVSTLIAREIGAQREVELFRSLDRIDFALPFQTGPQPQDYRVLVGVADEVCWITPGKKPIEVLQAPGGAPFVPHGVNAIVARRGHPLDLAIMTRRVATQADGRKQRGVYRLRRGRLEQIVSEADTRQCSYGPEGILCLTSASEIRLFAERTDASLEFLDAEENPRALRGTAWHETLPLLALAFDDEILVLDRTGELPNDARPDRGWNQFVGLRAPGSPPPSLHRAFRLEPGQGQRVASVLWHGDRLVWTLDSPALSVR